MVEFKREAKTGRAVFMEVNGRPWGSMQLCLFSGIDFPKFWLGETFICRMNFLRSASTSRTGLHAVGCLATLSISGT